MIAWCLWSEQRTTFKKCYSEFIVEFVENTFACKAASFQSIERAFIYFFTPFCLFKIIFMNKNEIVAGYNAKV